MFYNAKHAPILINSTGIIVTDAQINVQADLSPLYLSNQRHSNEYRPSNGIGGSLSLTYYFTGVDPLKNYLTDEQTVISGNFGGLYFSSGYLTSYSLSCAPNQVITIEAEITFFDELKGTFRPRYDYASDYPIFNYSDVSISDPTNGNIGNITNLINFSYQFSSDIQPLYLAGELLPSRISFGQKTISASLTTDNLNGDLPVSGKVAGINITFAHPSYPALSETYRVSGKLFQRDISTSIGSKVQSNLSVIQNYVDEPPTITSFEPMSADAGTLVRIQGTNLRQTSRLYFSDVNAVFYLVNDTEISGVVPPDAINGKITVYNNAGLAISVDEFTPIYGAIIVDELLNPSGLPSGIIHISGENFYRITDVIFNSGIQSDFVVHSPNIIEATIPPNVEWGPIWVQSSTRNISGLSSQRFVPIPQIYDFSPTQGVAGETISIRGNGFSSVTGVLFNNLPNINPYTADFTIIGNTGISVEIPTGNFKGYIKLLAQSGITSQSTNTFGANITITGLNPPSARTGDAIEILGSNFFADIMYSTNTNQYLVSFGNTDISGIFTRINSNKLTGQVPYNAQSGPVYLYQTDLTPFESTGNFQLRYHGPSISSTVPETGFYSGYAIIEGENFFDVTSVQLVGATGTITITSPTPYTSLLGDVISFQYPVATGGYYDVIINTSEGSATSYSGVFLRDYPVIYSIYPASGAIGAEITISGRNLHPDSEIYFNTTGLSATIVPDSSTTGHDVIKCYVPIQAQTGWNDILLFNNRDWVTGENAVRLINRPSIITVSPNTGIFGNVISMSGVDLGNITGLYIGLGRVTNFTHIGNTGISLTIPSDATTDFISGLFNGGNVSSTGIFNVLTPDLSVVDISPNSGYWLDTISIEGTNLHNAEYVIFSGATGEIIIDEDEFTIIDTTGITVQIPNGTYTGPISVRSDRMTATSIEEFLVIPTPYIATFSPNTGVYYNTTVFVSGQNLSGCSFLFQSPNSGRYVEAIGINIIEGTGASFRVPREIVNGLIHVSGMGRLWGGSSGNFYPTPTILSFSPTSLTTGDQLTINAINAGSASDQVLFITGQGELQKINDSPLVFDYSRISGGGIESLATGYTVITTNISGDFARSGALFLINNSYSSVIGVDSLTVSDLYPLIKFPSDFITGNLTITQGNPVIAGFTPNKGNSSTLVTITGDNLKTTTGVYLVSGVSNELGVIVSSGQHEVTFLPPANYSERSGQILLYTEYGNVTSLNYLTIIDTPIISGIYPRQGVTGEAISISGLGMRDVHTLRFKVAEDRIYTGQFTINEIGSIYQLNSTIPMFYENLERGIQIEVVSDAGTGVYSEQFFVHPGATEFWGSVSGKGHIGAAEGISIISGNGHHLQSGAILKMSIETQDNIQFHVTNIYYKDEVIRVTSIAN